MWNCETETKIRDDAKYYKNGSIYEGEFDKDGLPCYGKITYANGDVYEGPIREHWIKDDEEEDDDECYKNDSIFGSYQHDYPINSYMTTGYYEEEEEEQDEDYYYDEEVEPKLEKYGKLTSANGRVFWGVFCFKDRKTW
jgi:hypothetical protein